MSSSDSIPSELPLGDRVSGKLLLIGQINGYLSDLSGIANDLGLPRPSIINIEDYQTGFSHVDLPTHDVGHYLAGAVPPGFRWQTVGEMRNTNVPAAASLIHPSSSLDTTVAIGPGLTVNRLVSVGGDVTIGAHALINRQTSIGHHTQVSDFVTIGPGVTIASHVRLERGCFIGAGATVLPGITVGKNTIVGAGAVVTQSLPPHSVAVGNPARVIKTDQPGYEGFTVPD